MSSIRQICSATAMNLQSLRQRLDASLVVVIGIAGVVAVSISVLAMASGMIETIRNSGRDDRAIVLRKGAAAETGSMLTRQAARTILDAPGVKRDGEGRPIASVERVALINLYKKQDGSEVNAVLRGVGSAAELLRPEIKITSGRMFRPAVNELIVGKGAQAQFRNLDPGTKLIARGVSWTIVGVFESGQSSHESELIADADTLMSAERRDTFQSVSVLLDSARSLDAFQRSLTSNPALAVDVYSERKYFERQSETVSKMLFTLAYVVGGIMAAGAIFATLNTMYSAVSDRAREIATLRAIGFSPSAVVVSVLVEALILAVFGAGIGAILAWLFFNGRTASTWGGGPAGGQLIFAVTVTPALVVVGIVWACVIGLIGGLMPALSASRMSIASALRAV